MQRFFPATILLIAGFLTAGPGTGTVQADDWSYGPAYYNWPQVDYGPAYQNWPQVDYGPDFRNWPDMEGFTGFPNYWPLGDGQCYPNCYPMPYGGYRPLYPARVRPTGNGYAPVQRQIPVR